MPLGNRETRMRRKSARLSLLKRNQRLLKRCSNAHSGRSRRHDISWSSRSFVSRSGDAELFHAAAKRVRVKVEKFSCAAWAINNPLGLRQDLQDVASFHAFQAGWLGFCGILSVW